MGVDTSNHFLIVYIIMLHRVKLNFFGPGYLVFRFKGRVLGDVLGDGGRFRGRAYVYAF
jgi:hypothetical protein